MGWSVGECPCGKLGGSERIPVTLSPPVTTQMPQDTEPAWFLYLGPPPPHFHPQNNHSTDLYNPLQLTQDFHTCYVSSCGGNIIFCISQVRREVRQLENAPVPGVEGA